MWTYFANWLAKTFLRLTSLYETPVWYQPRAGERFLWTQTAFMEPTTLLSDDFIRSELRLPSWTSQTLVSRFQIPLWARAYVRVFLLCLPLSCACRETIHPRNHKTFPIINSESEGRCITSSACRRKHYVSPAAHCWGPLELLQATNKTENVNSLEYTIISKVLFTPHHEVIVALMWSTAIVVQQCVRTTILHSCTHIATKMADARGYPSLMANAGERWPVGQSPWSNNRWGPDPNEESILWKGLDAKAPEVK
jgi:hypothetical protein